MGLEINTNDSVDINPVIIPSRRGQDITYWSLGSYLTSQTKSEALGNLHSDLIKDLDEGRKVYESLAISLEYDKVMDAFSWLLVGIGKYIPTAELDELAYPEKYSKQYGIDTVLRARLILKKLETNKE